MRFPYLIIQLTNFCIQFQELIFTAGATVMYCISFIVLLAGFGYCAGNVPKCDARVAAGVSKLNKGLLKKWTKHSNLAMSIKERS